MGKGIHGNYSCVRCGACCVYFLIDAPGEKPFGFKPSDTPCEYMHYDSRTQKATCEIHDRERPKCCSDFFCGDKRVPDLEKGRLLMTLANMENIFSLASKRS